MAKPQRHAGPTGVRDDRALSFRNYWWHDQEYRFSILVRAEVPGQYTVLPTKLWGMYLPYSTPATRFG